MSSSARTAPTAAKKPVTENDVIGYSPEEWRVVLQKMGPKEALHWRQFRRKVKNRISAMNSTREKKVAAKKLKSDNASKTARIVALTEQLKTQTRYAENMRALLLHLTHHVASK